MSRIEPIEPCIKKEGDGWMVYWPSSYTDKMLGIYHSSYRDARQFLLRVKRSYG